MRGARRENDVSEIYLCFECFPLCPLTAKLPLLPSLRRTRTLSHISITSIYFSMNKLLTGLGIVAAKPLGLAGIIPTTLFILAIEIVNAELMLEILSGDLGGRLHHGIIVFGIKEQGQAVLTILIVSAVLLVEVFFGVVFFRSLIFFFFIIVVIIVIIFHVIVSGIIAAAATALVSTSELASTWKKS